MAKKGGKSGDEKKVPRKVITLTKNKEEKSWKGRRITFVAVLTEDGKPVAEKSISFFCGNEHIGDADTNAHGKATHSHLLKGGAHTVTAEYDNVKSNAVTVEIQKPATGDVVIRSWEIRDGGGSYRILFQVLRSGKPVPGAVLRIATQRINIISIATKKENCLAGIKIIVSQNIVLSITHDESNASIFKALFNR